jgi:hypothetical protein
VPLTDRDRAMVRTAEGTGPSRYQVLAVPQSLSEGMTCGPADSRPGPGPLWHLPLSDRKLMPCSVQV